MNSTESTNHFYQNREDLTSIESRFLYRLLYQYNCRKNDGIVYQLKVIYEIAHVEFKLDFVSELNDVMELSSYPTLIEVVIFVLLLINVEHP